MKNDDEKREFYPSPSGKWVEVRNISPMSFMVGNQFKIDYGPGAERNRVLMVRAVVDVYWIVFREDKLSTDKYTLQHWLQFQHEVKNCTLYEQRPEFSPYEFAVRSYDGPGRTEPRGTTIADKLQEVSEVLPNDKDAARSLMENIAKCVEEDGWELKKDTTPRQFPPENDESKEEST